MDRSGQELGGWQLVALLGRGGVGEVYRARRPGEPDRALKLLSGDLPDRAQAARRFRREVTNLRELDHPGIVRYLDSGVAGDQPFLVMELIEGQDLAAMLERGDTLRLHDALRLSHELTDALAFLHSRGMVHRDLKPSNVLLGPDGKVRLTDFGLSRTDEQTEVTRSNAVVGTVQCLSPERVAGDPATPASDMYALGLILYELVTGTFPFRAESTREWVEEILETVPRPPHALVPNIPAALDETIIALLAKSPKDRPDAAHVAGVLARLLQPLHERTSGRMKRPGSQGTRAPAPAVAAAPEPATAPLPPPPRAVPPAAIAALCAAVLGLLAFAASPARVPQEPRAAARPATTP